MIIIIECFVGMVISKIVNLILIGCNKYINMSIFNMLKMILLFNIVLVFLFFRGRILLVYGYVIFW